MSKIEVNEITARTGTNIEIPTGHTLQAPGHVIQFQHVNFTNNITISSSTFTDITGGTLTITPQSSSSKIFVIIDCAVYVATTSITYGYCGSKIIRGSSTEVSAANMVDGTGPYTYGSSATGFGQFDARHWYSAVDSPSTTSATTYKIQGARYGSGSVVYNNAGASSNIIAMEIAQ